MNIIDLLIQQHRETEAAFASGDSAAVASGLRLHDRIETTLLYPEASAAGVEGVDYAEEEHTSVREMLERLDAGEDVLAELQEAVEAHVEEEESNLLPAIREAIPDERLEELGEQAASEGQPAQAAQPAQGRGDQAQAQASQGQEQAQSAEGQGESEREVQERAAQERAAQEQASQSAP